MSVTLTEQQKARIRETEDFWLATVRSTGAPHLVPIWAILVDEVIYMGTQPKSQKVRNLLANSGAVLALPDTRNVLILEGKSRILEQSAPTGVMERFKKKYDWSFTPGGEWILLDFVPFKIIRWESGE